LVDDALQPEEGDQQPLTRRRRALIWTGAIATILGTLGTLAFGAVTAYLDYQVATDQLEQSKEQAQEKLREHASKVAAWTDDPTKDTPSALYVANRSAAPVHFLHVYFEGSRTVNGTVEFNEYEFERRSLAPCTILKIPHNGFRVNPKEKPRKLQFMTIRWTSFKDGQYRDWANTGSELISDSAKIIDMNMNPPAEPGQEVHSVDVVKSETTQTDACG
jgi:hypothetical protein